MIDFFLVSHLLIYLYFHYVVLLKQPKIIGNSDLSETQYLEVIRREKSKFDNRFFLKKTEFLKLATG